MMKKQIIVRGRIVRVFALLVLGLALLLPAEARAQFQVLGATVAPAFRDVTDGASRSTVIVKCDGRRVALGTVIAADGWILTKASELSGRITCQVRGRDLEARLMGVAEEYDLAMLKVEAENLAPARFSESAITVGRWVASPGPGSALPVGVGVVSVGPRRIASRDVMLGVSLADAENGVRVVQVSPDSGAEKAGMQVDDIVTAINGQAVKQRIELTDAITMRQVGDQVRLSVLRAGQAVELVAPLGQRSSASRSDRMNTMGGPLSRRKAGFPIALQHDTVLKPEECGGPLVGLDGDVIGINIARAGRTESYAVPANVLAGLIQDLRGGRHNHIEPGRLPTASVE
jgi:serine protease Do